MSQPADLFRFIDDQREQMLERVTRWAEINSFTSNLAGVDACTESLLPAVVGLGGEIRWVDLPPLRVIGEDGRESEQRLGRMLRVSKRPGAGVSLLLGIHYDTVYSPADEFRTVWRDGDRLRGPGVLDAKGGIAVMLTALAAFERSTAASRVGWEVFLNPDEEIGSPGSGALIAEMARGKTAALLFEPAQPDGSLVSSRKGSGNFTVVVTGRSAHAGRDPSAGRNAIHLLAEMVSQIAAMNDPATGTTTNVGRIAGGGAVNVVPDLAICRFNVRVATREAQQTVESRLAEMQQSFGVREGFGVRIDGGFSAPPKPVDPASQRLMDLAAMCGAELGLPLRFAPSGGVCDGNRVAGVGTPCIDSLGPRGGEIHSPREFLIIDSLAERAKLAALLMLRIAERGSI